MKFFNIVRVIFTIKSVMNTLLICVFIHLLFAETANALPPFIEAIISPFVDLFSFVGISVRKQPKHELLFTSSKSEGSHYEQEIKANVHEVEYFDSKFSAKVVEVTNPYDDKFNLKPPLTEPFNCDAEEIPILLINNNAYTYIMTSKSTEQNKEFVNWNRYEKVSQIKTFNRYGYNITLEELLNDVSRPKKSNKSKHFQPVASIVQGGLSNALNAVQTPTNNNNNPTNDEKTENNQHNCNESCEENIKSRPNFPVYAPIIQRY